MTHPILTGLLILAAANTPAAAMLARAEMDADDHNDQDEQR